jgi:hypothetical protein
MGSLLGDELVKFIIQLSFILQAKSYILASLLHFVNRHDLPSLKHFINPFCFGVVAALSVSWGLKQARQIAIALLTTHPVSSDPIN